MVEWHVFVGDFASIEAIIDNETTDDILLDIIGCVSRKVVDALNAFSD